jgi:hypothetical protein
MLHEAWELSLAEEISRIYLPTTLFKPHRSSALELDHRINMPGKEMGSQSMSVDK